MDYVAALAELLKQQPELILDAQRIFFDGVPVGNPDLPNVTTNSYEAIYKAVKAIADKQTLRA